MKRCALAILSLALVGCGSTPVVLDGKYRHGTKPAYVDYFDYYVFGLVGHPTVNVQKACVDQKPLAVQRYFSVEDGVISFVTLGIYTPMTVRVWCGD